MLELIALLLIQLLKIGSKKDIERRLRLQCIDRLVFLEASDRDQVTDGTYLYISV